MATIGLDKLVYAPITEDKNGNETYGTPVQLAKAISADLSIELNEAILFADDGQSETVKEFKSGTISLGVDDIGNEAAVALVGATLDSNGVLISGGEDISQYVAIGFRAKKSNGKYKYYLEFLQLTLLLRVIQSLSQLRLLKVLFIDAINLMARTSILGKRKSLKHRKTTKQSMLGTIAYTSLNTKEVRRNGR